MNNGSDGCWFNLPQGVDTARELEVTIPVKGRVMCPASIMLEVDEWRDLLRQSMEKQSFVLHGRLGEMLRHCLHGYENIASSALRGAESYREDSLVWLRAIAIVIESIVDDHLNHSQKNERLRGLLGVVEREIHKLRQLQFEFRGQAWHRGFDTFRWDGPERHLREKVSELQRENDDLRRQIGQEPSPTEIEEVRF